MHRSDNLLVTCTCFFIYENDPLNCVHATRVLILQCVMQPVIHISTEPYHERTNNVVSTRSKTNQAVQPQKIAGGWKFWI